MRDPLFAGVAAAFGALFGSFLNVCIYRFPRDMSIVTPPSTCPACDRRIPWYDNVPVFGWLLLRGRCRQCRAPISVQYPLVEAVVALLWGGAVWWYGLGWPGVTVAVFLTILLGIAVTDARHYVIPDEFTWGGLVIGLLLALPGGGDTVARSVVGAVVGFALLYAIAWTGELAFKKEAMGGGDIKMMAMVGAFVGWKGVLLTVFGGALLGTVIFVPISLKTKKLVPFGIFLAAGAAVAILVGEPIYEWYSSYLRGS